MFRRNTYAKIAALMIIAVITAINAPPAARTVFNTYVAAKDRKLPIYSVERPDRKVSLSFDAAWGADDTDTLLQILKDNDVLTTFFLCGYWVDKHPEQVKKIAAAGHDIGNHGNTHAHGGQLSLEQNKKEIQDCHEKIKAVTGIEADLFRPPYGEYNNTVMTAAEELGYFVIQWDVDSLDWKKLGEQQEIDRVLNNKALQSGSIILFHNDAPNTPKTLDRIIKGLKEKGYEIVPISQLIHRENYFMDHTGRQKLR
jgi:polysaccharide deacetylase family sporulation protein PdaB